MAHVFYDPNDDSLLFNGTRYVREEDDDVLATCPGCAEVPSPFLNAFTGSNIVDFKQKKQLHEVEEALWAALKFIIDAQQS